MCARLNRALTMKRDNAASGVRLLVGRRISLSLSPSLHALTSFFTENSIDQDKHISQRYRCIIIATSTGRYSIIPGKSSRFPVPSNLAGCCARFCSTGCLNCWRELRCENMKISRISSCLFERNRELRRRKDTCGEYYTLLVLLRLLKLLNVAWYK